MSKKDTGEAAPSAEKKGPAHWALQCGQVVPVRNPGLHGQTLYKGAHAGASALHGWAEYEYHNSAPFLLTREDYEAALKAAMTTTKTGKTVPHGPANAGA